MQGATLIPSRAAEARPRVRAVIAVMQGHMDRSLLKADRVCSVSAARREPKGRPAVSDRRLEALIQEREAEVPVPPFPAYLDGPSRR